MLNPPALWGGFCYNKRRMEAPKDNLYRIADESHSRRPLLIALIVLILAALAVVVWWQNTDRVPSEEPLSEAEAKDIRDFLNQETEVPTEEEASIISDYLNTPSEADSLSDYEKEQILEYLN